MPEDVFAVRVQDPDRIQSYVKFQIADWYKFVRQTLGRRDIKNGDLRVVHSYRKSTAFGIASISTSRKLVVTQLTFQERQNSERQMGYKYRWSLSGFADTKTGPSLKESSELMYPLYGTSQTIPENQCLFVSTIDVKLSKSVWKAVNAPPLVSVEPVDADPSASAYSHGEGPWTNQSHSGLEQPSGDNNSVPFIPMDSIEDSAIVVQNLAEVSDRIHRDHLLTGSV